MSERTPIITIRRGQSADIRALTEIYNHYITNTHFTFDVEPFAVEVRAQKWFEQFESTGRHQLFVAVEDANDSKAGRIFGYASSTAFKSKQAYETSVEFTIYLAPECEHGRGIGRRLYEALIAALADEDVHRAYAGVALPNEESLLFHQRMGFTEVGTYREVGRKFGQYWDVTWLERAL